MVQQLRELAAPAEDQSSFCSNHIKWFSHSSSAPGNLTCASGLHGTETHLHINAHK